MIGILFGPVLAVMVNCPMLERKDDVNSDADRFFR